MIPTDEHADPTDRIAFETELKRLVSDARNGAIAVEGTYNVRSPRRDGSDYTIEISERIKRVADGGVAATSFERSVSGASNEARAQCDAVDRFLK